MRSLLNRVLVGVLVAVCAGCSRTSTPTAPSNPALATAVPVTEVANLAGEYKITLAAQDCEPAFPAAARTRTYSSRLDQQQRAIDLVLTDLPDIFSIKVTTTLRGIIQPPSLLTISGYLGNDQWVAIFELITSANLLSILVDDMIVTPSPEGLVGTFSGSLMLYDGGPAGWPTVGSRCSSQRHAVALARQDR